MEILGVGMPELMFILIIALIILGPRDMEKAGRTIGKWLRNIVTSDGWKIFQQTSREVRNLPNRLIREANEEMQKLNGEINNSIGVSNPMRYGNFTAPVGSRPVQPLPTTDTALDQAAEPQQQITNEEETKTPDE